MKRLTLHRSQSFRGPLILVNRDHPLQEIETPELIPLDAAYPDIRMERRAGKLLSACIQAAGGRGTIVPVSGWRSFGEQQSIWDDTLAKEGETFTRQYVAFPGCSEHQTGLAMDLAKAAPSIDFIRPDFPDEGPCGTFRRLAAQYGFIQRYRREKEAVTHIAEEPWHFRYVGVPHARLLTENALCLEEYRAFLQQGDRTVRLPGGRRVRVGWLPCRSAAVRWTPPAACWQVSGDNDGGFITTVWEG